MYIQKELGGLREITGNLKLYASKDYSSYYIHNSCYKEEGRRMWSR